MAIKWLKAEVTGICDATENTRRFFFRVPELEVFNFKPGQFVSFDLPIHEKKNLRLRSYSIASAPNGANEFELAIVFVPGGLASEYLWNQIKPGSEILFRGPLGVFTLPDKIEADLCFVATGTGVAPFRSMLLDLKNHPRPHQNIFLVFGTRYEKDILYEAEMGALQSQIPGFKFLTTLSRENSPEYKGRKGYVHPIYEELFADRRAARFYLCGWRNMIDEAQQRILTMGYHQQSIHMEIYG